MSIELKYWVVGCCFSTQIVALQVYKLCYELVLVLEKTGILWHIFTCL